jgi:hypothetical protein
LNTAFERRHHKRIDGRSPDAHVTAMRRFHESVADLLRRAERDRRADESA